VSEQTQIETVHIPDTPEVLAAPPRALAMVTEQLAAGQVRASSVPTDTIPTRVNILLFQMNLLGMFTSADAIAEYLANRGIKGDRSLLESCPLSNLALKTLDNGMHIEVDKEALFIHASDSTGWYRIPLTPVLSDFVARFDRGEYPQLVA